DADAAVVARVGASPRRASGRVFDDHAAAGVRAARVADDHAAAGVRAARVADVLAAAGVRADRVSDDLAAAGVRACLGAPLGGARPPPAGEAGARVQAVGLQGVD